MNAMICETVTAPTRMNAFQRLMYQWNELHPYQAIHSYTIDEPLCLLRLQRAIAESYQHCGLGWVVVEPDGRSYRHTVDACPAVDVLAGGEQPHATLLEHVNRELNRPFDRSCGKPMRFSVVDRGRGGFVLNLAYDHWIADSTAARALLRHVLGRYWHLPIPENQQPLDLDPATYRDVFSHQLRWPRLAAAALRCVGHWWRNRSVARVPYSSFDLMTNGYRLYPTQPGTVARLQRFARRQGGTVHDVILAALGRALAATLPRRALREGRHLALGTIVDTRSDANRNLSDSFAAYLGYYLVRMGCDQPVSLSEATQRMAAATREIKTRKTYLDSLVNMKLASGIWARLPAAPRRHFMHDAFPLTAGVSNVCLRESWIDRWAGGRIVDYSRAASTGPILPLTLTPTTLGTQMNVGVSYRVTGFTREKIDRLMDMFLDQIEHPAAVRVGGGIPSSPQPEPLLGVGST
jgi:hypothetical protein